MGYIILLAMLGTIIYYGYQGFKVIKAYVERKRSEKAEQLSEENQDL